MGRTIPSFRMASAEERKEWKEFRKALDKSDRKAFDSMFDIALKPSTPLISLHDCWLFNLLRAICLLSNASL
jgi:hypothetical protein